MSDHDDDGCVEVDVKTYRNLQAIAQILVCDVETALERVISEYVPADEDLGGWRGVPREPAVECVYCGYRLGASTWPMLRESKSRHRSACLAPGVGSVPQPGLLTE